MQNVTGMNTVWEKREKLRPMVEFVAQVVKYQHCHGRHFLIKNPLTSRIWYEPEMASLLALPGVTYGDLDMCVFGARDPESYKFVLKLTSLMHNFEPGVLSPIFRRCSNRDLSKKHEHQDLVGRKRQGLWFSNKHPASFQQYLNVRPSNRITSLFVDMIEDMSDRDCSSLLSCFLVNERSIMDFSSRIRMKTLLNTNQSKSLYVDHPEFRRRTKAIMRYTSHLMELNMNSQDFYNPIISDLTTGCLHLRKLFRPSYPFDQCTVLHSNLGQYVRFSSPPSFAVLCLWHVSRPNHVYVFHNPVTTLIFHQ